MGGSPAVLLQLAASGGGGVFGGALGSLVAESLGSRRPSFLCLDTGTAGGRAIQHSRAPSFAASSAGSSQVCLICLDALAPEDFDSGEALAQACACKGDVALRHKRCAVQWSLVKRSTVCDVCRRPITNLPDLPPPEPPAAGADGEVWDPLALGQPLGLGDYLVDCVRVAWMALVVGILVFDMSVSRAAVTGAVIGVVLTAAAHALVLAQRSAAAVRTFAAALRERAWVQGQHQQLAAAVAVAAEAWELPEGEVGRAAGGDGVDSGSGALQEGRAPARPGHTRAPSSTVLLIREEEGEAA